MAIRPAHVVKMQLDHLLRIKKMFDGIELVDFASQFEFESICREEAELRQELALAQMNESHSHAK